MKRLVVLTALALGGLLALAGPASAHVTVSSPDATRGGYAVVAFRVPTESATASTTKLVVQLPPFASVGVQPMAGWTESTQATKLAKPLTTDDGDRITSAVSRITWTARPGNAIKPGQFQQFFVQVGALPDAPSVTFKAVQTYSDGTVVRWVETAAPGSKVEPEHPAPVLELAATSADSSPAATASASSSGSSNTGPVVLSIIALVVAAAALGLAFVTRARRIEPPAGESP